MRRIRIGNDFQIRWAIEREGIPEPLDAATDIKILVELNYLCSSNQRVNKPLTAFTVSGNYVFMDFTAEFCSQYGDYRIIMQYTIPDSGMLDGDRKIVTDITPFTIVGASEDADSSADFFVDSYIVTGFKGDDGLSSFEVWLLDNPTGTIEEYFAFLQNPAYEAGITAVEAAQISVLAKEHSESAKTASESARDTANTQAGIATTKAQEAFSSAQNAASSAAIAGDKATLALSASTQAGLYKNAAETAQGLAEDAEAGAVSAKSYLENHLFHYISDDDISVNVGIGHNIKVSESTVGYPSLILSLKTT